MLHPHLGQLNTKRIILASASPRRQDILGKQLGLKFEVVVSSFDELLPKQNYKGPEGAARYAVDTAKGKVLDVCKHLCDPEALKKTGQVVPDLIIGADTVVEHDGIILEKPDDDAMARDMLSRLSGGIHHVHTGVVLVIPQLPGGAGSPHADGPFVHTFSSTTTVEFDDLTPEVIQAYIDSGEPFGKAGSYGIQGIAGSFVRRIDGCFFTVVGFPVYKFASEMVQLIQQGKLKLE